MPKVHRDGDLRSCDATTTVIGQGFVKSNGKLWAVEGDPNSDGNGQLIASQGFVTVSGKKVIIHKPDDASADDKCEPLGGEHCHPHTAEGSPNTFIGGA